MERAVPSYMKVEVGNILSVGLIILCSLSIYNTKIPELMVQIKTEAGLLIDKHKFDNLFGGKEMFLLYRMEKKDEIYMSACGAVYFKRSFLISALGALFTYGLVIYNLKTTENSF
ncbi:uncharacterized protein NPIL_247141 [Nephila pilipes]|uniref:Uncharacterized protein n=1 Tax=Nephila pilipes TaxID=299642 RepID=A0A8X6PGU1_NEPPI|nr:uncharacterized protein NPIL_247141 [Nephila pilipes]